MYTFASDQFVNWNFFCLLYVFLFGSFAYFLVMEYKQIKGVVYGIVITAVGWIVGNRSGFLVFGFGFFLMLLLASVLPFKWNNKKLNCIVQWLSASTYSVYLTHWFVLQFLGEAISQMPWISGYFVFVIISWIVGGLAYQFIERPIYRVLNSMVCSPSSRQ